MPGHQRQRLSFTVLFVCLSMIAAFAQSTGEITGTIADPQAGVLPGAQVEITNHDTGVTTATVTNNDGIYRFPNLLPGTYRLTISLPAFKRALVKAVTVEVGRVTRVDATLELAAGVDEELTVTAGVPLLDLDNGTKGQIIDSRQIENLPLQSKNPLALLNLAPGVASQSGGTIANRQGSDGTGITSAYSINGGVRTNVGGFNEFVVDGISVTNRRDGTVLALPGADGLQEFRVQAGGMSAEYGHTVGGVLNYVTKTGTNTLRGTLFENNRSTPTTARRALPINTEKPGTIYNQFGGVVGGPVRLPGLYDGRDRTFFFGSYDGSRWIRKTPSTATIPTAKMRTGDFSELAQPIFDPASAATPAARMAFAGNQIPAERWNAIGQTILETFPLPNLPGTANNYQGVFRVDTPVDVYSARVDHTFTSSQRLFAKLTRVDSVSYADFVLGKADLSTQNLDLPSRNYAIGYNAILSATAVYNVTAGYTRFVRTFLDASDNTVGGGFFGYTVTPAPASGSPANIRPSATFDIYRGLGTSSPQKQVAESIQINQSLSWLLGRHNLKLGADIRHYITGGYVGSASPNGTFGFNALQTSNGAGGTGNSAASLLLGLANTYNFQQPPDVRLGVTTPAIYISDDFKITPRLTLNLGLRWEMEGPLREQHDRVGYFDGQTINSLVNRPGVFQYAGQNGNPRGITAGDRNNIGPRVGFAWAPGGTTPSTVVRGAFGVYYSPIPLVGFYSQADGYDSRLTTIKPNATAPAIVLGTQYTLPPAVGPLGEQAFLGIGVSQPFERDVRNPEIYQWNLGVQRELGRSLVVELLYSGNRGAHLIALENINRPPQALIDEAIAVQAASGRSGDAQAFLNQAIPNPLAGRVPGTLGAATITRANASVPFPQYGAITVPRNSLDSIYHSMQAKLEQRLTGDLSFLLAYTFSKQIDNAQSVNLNSSEVSNVGNLQNPYDLRDARAVGNFDRTHVFAGNVVYTLPFGADRRFLSEGWASRLAGGLQLTAVLSLQSGVPLAVTQSEANGLGLGGARPDLVGDPAAGRGTVNSGGSIQWINRDAYRAVNGRYGTAPLRDDHVRGPGFYQLDLGLQRDLRVTPRMSLRLRVEAFNLLNRANLALPTQDLSSPAFGQINAVYDPRVLQFGAQIKF